MSFLHRQTDLAQRLGDRSAQDLSDADLADFGKLNQGGCPIGWQQEPNFYNLGQLRAARKCGRNVLD
jgi:hypothetical protein